MAHGSPTGGVDDLIDFPLLEALFGRRSRRFFVGAEIPDGIFAYKSKHPPLPLSELERLLVVSACGGGTGWHNMIYRGKRYAPHLSNYAGAAGGRTFPSAAGFHTSKTFFTDDTGIYVLENRDAASVAEKLPDGSFDLDDILNHLRQHTRKISNSRLALPDEPPYVEAHNTWSANRPGTLLVIPVGDLAQHALLGICYLLQNGQVLTDDISGRTIPGIEQFKDMFDSTNVWPLSFFEQWSMAELTVELSTSCYAGTLMLQAMGLGGWMYNGLDPFSLLGTGREEGVPGLGFRYDRDERWPYPNPTGLEGVLEGFCPPHYADMRAAVDAIVERKFGSGGPYNPQTPGPWKDSPRVRSAAQVHSERFRECVALQAQYVYETFGKFPGTVPSMFCIMYLQAHHLDLDFYDRFYKPGAYLTTHAEHMQKWHA